MDRGRGGQDVARSPATRPGRRPSRSPLPRPPARAGRPAATSQGPRPSSKNPSNTPAAVQARSRLAAPTRRRSSTTVERRPVDREVAVDPLLVPEREAGRGDRFVRRARADRQRRAVARRAATERRASRCRRASARARRRRSAAPSCTSPTDTPTAGRPVQEVRGAVERVDEPSERRALAAALLAEERDAGHAAASDRAPRSRSRCRRRSPSRPAPSRGVVARATEAGEHDLAADARRALRRPAGGGRDRDRSPGRRAQGLEQLAACRRRRAGGARSGRRSRAAGPRCR